MTKQHCFGEPHTENNDLICAFELLSLPGTIMAAGYSLWAQRQANKDWHDAKQQDNGGHTLFSLLKNPQVAATLRLKGFFFVVVQLFGLP